MKTITGTLYIVATPIGNPDDISLRAVKILKQCDLVVCEEGKVGARLLHHLRVSKPLEELHEHNEQEQTAELIVRLEEGASIALISDAGTPLFADPGLEFVQRAVQKKIAIVPVPGASSIMTALVASCLPMQQFLFGGFLSREPRERRYQLQMLAEEPRTVVLLETPYRLLPLLEAAADVMPSRRAFLGCNLTMPSETLHYGTVAELFAKFQENRFKGEFVLVFAGSEKVQRVGSRDAKKTRERRSDGGERRRDHNWGKKKSSNWGEKRHSGFGKKRSDSKNQSSKDRYRTGKRSSASTSYSGKFGRKKK